MVIRARNPLPTPTLRTHPVDSACDQFIIIIIFIVIFFFFILFVFFFFISLFRSRSPREPQRTVTSAAVLDDAGEAHTDRPDLEPRRFIRV